MDANSVFKEEVADDNTPNPYDRHLDAALRAFDAALPLVVCDELSLTAGQSQYAAPADAWRFHSAAWTEAYRELDVWQRPKRLPQARLRVADGQRIWVFNPVPSSSHLAALGSVYDYQYYAHHSIGDSDADATIELTDKPLFLLRAQAEAMKDIALRNSAKPVEIRASGSVSTVNGPAKSLYEQLMKQFNAQIEAQR